MSKLAAAGLSSTVAGAARRPRARRGRSRRRSGRPPRGGRALGARQAGGAEQRTRASGRSRRSGRRRPRARPRPAAAPTGRCPCRGRRRSGRSAASKARSAAITASGCVPCESLTKRTPSIDRDGLEAMLDAGEAAAAARIAAGGMPNRSATATAARAFETLWRPGIASSAADDPAAGSGRCRPAAGERQPSTPRRRSVRRRPRPRRRPAATAVDDRARPGVRGSPRRPGRRR